MSDNEQLTGNYSTLQNTHKECEATNKKLVEENDNLEDENTNLKKELAGYVRTTVNSGGGGIGFKYLYL